MLVNVNGTNMYMYVNKRIELTQQGIALKCMYTCMYYYYYYYYYFLLTHIEPDSGD